MLVEFIISHGNTDFDSLASMVAAHKLYPQARMVFTGKLSREVKEFMSFYKDLFDIKQISQVDVNEAARLIIVDTAVRNRIGKFQDILTKEGLDIHIYDHHVGNDNLQGNIHIIEPLGATATMLVEMIKERGIPLTPMEATVIALGIYGDTDCLTYSSTTHRDVEAVAFLLAAKANLKVIREFIGRPLDGEQRDVLNHLLASMETYQIQGLKIIMAKAVANDYIDGLASLAYKVQSIENPDALFILAQMGNRVHIVARSKAKEVRVNDILRPLGGGGHSKAASTAIKGRKLPEVYNQLYDLILEKVKPLFVARDIMSSPVKTIFPETSIRGAERIMARYGHTGLPVVDGEGRLKGIISRRDVDKARQHGYTHLPVKGFMSSRIVTIDPDTTFQDIQKLIIEHDIGRLPVVENQRLLGIVSRTDILRNFHEEEEEEQEEIIETQNIWERKNVKGLMRERLPLEIQCLLHRVGELAQQKGQKVFVVGGFVRDLLLGKRNLDIDLVVEGDGMEFAQYLSQELGGLLRIHKDFGTATLNLPDGQKLDVATSRREFYEYPAVLPTVEVGSIKQDLYRRDFTINAMAVQLNPSEYGELVDFFGGQKDLQNGWVRVLYNLSFIEDPTRIFRAFRFEQRYNFKIEEQTAGFIRHALSMGVLTQLSGTRLKNEFLLILKEKKPFKVLKRAQDWNLLSYINPQLKLDKEIAHLLAHGEMILNHFAQDLKEREKILVYFLILVHKLEDEEIENIASILEFTKEDIEKLLLGANQFKLVEDFLQQDQVKPSEIDEKLAAFPLGILCFFLAKTQGYKVKKRIVLFLQKLKNLKMDITGKDLMKLGYKPGPLFKDVLQEVRKARLDDLVRNKEEELSLAKNLMEKRLKEGKND